MQKKSSHFIFFISVVSFSLTLNTHALTNTTTNKKITYDSAWSDLGKKQTFYGSEKEDKYPVRALVFDIESWDNHYSLEALWLYRYTSYPKFKEHNFWPLYSSKWAKQDDRLKWRILNVTYKNDDYNTAFNFWPLYFQNSKHIGESKFYSTLLPLYYYSHKRYNNYSKTRHFSFLHYYHNRGIDGKEKYLTLALPIIPVIYYSKNKYRSHYNLGWINDFEFKNGSLTHFWFAPIIFWKKNSYFHLAPLYFSSENPNTIFGLGYYYKQKKESYDLLLLNLWLSPNKDNSSYAFFPLFYNSDKRSNANSNSSLITPLFFSSTQTSQSMFWAPIIPIYFHNKWQGGSELNIAYLFHKSTRKGKLSGLYLLPLLAYSPNNYLHIVPLYFSAIDNKNERLFFGPGYYYHRTKNIYTNWMALYFKRENKTLQSNYLHIFPVYYSWETSKSEGSLSIPFSFTYKDATRYLHINLSGVSWRRQTGFILPVGLSKSDGVWYLETEFSWLYDLFSIATRSPIGAGKPDGFKSQVETVSSDAILPQETKLVIEKNFEQEPSDKLSNVANDKSKVKFIDTEVIANETKENVKLDKEHDSVTKGKAKNYFALHLLYGLYAYEKADEINHFRALPLAWLTWSKNASDKFLITPLFFSYQRKDLSYFALLPLPLYASQHEKNDTFKSYGMILYWNEYKEKNNYFKTSILWPFINYYTSDKESGYRFFPLFWQNSNSQKTAFTSPFFKYTKEKKDERTESETSIPYIPLLYYSNHLQEKDYSHQTSYNLFMLSYSEATSYTTKTSVEIQKEFYSPFYISMSTESKPAEDAPSNRLNKTKFFPIPFVYYQANLKKSYTNVALLFGWDNYTDKSDNSSFMALPLYWSEKSKYSNFLYIGGYYQSHDDHHDYYNLAFYSFTYSKFDSKYSKTREYCIALASSCAKYTDKSSHYYFLYYLGGSYRSYSNDNFSFNLSLLYWHKYEKDYATTSVLLPIYYLKLQEYSSGFILPTLSYFNNYEGGSTQLHGLGLLWYQDWREGYNSRSSVLLGALYNQVYRKSRGYSSYGSLWGFLWDYEKESETKWSKFSILKFVFSRTTQSGHTTTRLLGIPVYKN